jgi:outer membrane lipoprotein-sorting protein
MRQIIPTIALSADPWESRCLIRQVLSWMDGRATITFTSIQINAKIDDSKFGKPAAPVSTTPGN